MNNHRRFFVALLLSGLVEFAVPAGVNGQVRMVLAIDTDVVGAGVDARRIKRTFAIGLGNRFQVDREFVGSNLGSRSVAAHYERMRSSVNETLIFFYVGHGFTDDGEHFLDFGNQPLARGVLRRAMQRTGAGLVVILTDTCSRRDSFNGRLADRLPADYAAYGAEQPSNSRWAERGFSQLFMKSRGLVDVNASTYDRETGGEIAWGDTDNGGLFTNTLCGLLLSRFDVLDTDPRDGFLTWAEVYTHLRSEMRTNFGRMKRNLLRERNFSAEARDRLIDSTTQTPQAWSLVDERDRLEMVTVWERGEIVVDEVFRRGAADRGGLRPGDTILEIDGRRIQSEAGYLRQIHLVPSGSRIRLTVRGLEGRIAECRVRVAE